MEENRPTGNTEQKRRVRSEGTEGAPKRRVRPEGTEGTAKKRVRSEGTEGTTRRRVRSEDAGDAAKRRARREEVERGRVRRAETYRDMYDDYDDDDEYEYRQRRQSGVKPGHRRGSRYVDSNREKLQAARGGGGSLGTIGKSLITIILVLILIAAVGGTAFLLYWKKYGPSNATYDLKNYYGIESSEQIGLTLNNEVSEQKAYLFDGKVYLSYETVRDYVNERIYFDRSQNVLMYTLPTEIFWVWPGENNYTVYGQVQQKDYVIFRQEGENSYVALDFIQEYTKLDYTLSTEEPARLRIVTEFGEIQTAAAKREAAVRFRAGYKSPILTNVPKGEKVTVLNPEGDWYKVCTADGIIGYVHKSHIKKPQAETIDKDFNEPEFTSIQQDEKVVLGWHQVTSQRANEWLDDALNPSMGVNVISPTWYSVVDSQGNISSIASSDYVDKAHSMGAKVWALVDNFNDNENDMELLSNMNNRVNLENQLIEQTLGCGADGINIDFERIQTEVGEHYIQFIREMSVRCRQAGLVLSIDNYVPMGYNAHYHKAEQGKVADYVIIMGYDEHYGGSLEAGSVASYGYVKNGIEATLKDVPAEKIINGVPFYTRLWAETEKSQEQLDNEKGTEAGNYPTNVTSEAMGMSSGYVAVANAGAEISWDDNLKQNYAAWQDGDTKYQIWLEDTASLEAKLQLIRDNNLAGVACWKLTMETADVWGIISQYMH